jgi:restriction endonuclease S subunit
VRLLAEVQSLVYFKFPDQINDRLSFGDNHPERISFFKRLKDVKEKGVDVRPLTEVADPIEERVNPSKSFPNQTVNYLGLGDIERDTGRARFRKMLGKDILSASAILRKGNIAFARLRPYLNKAHLIEVGEAVGSGELFVIEPRQSEVVPEFLLRYLLSPLVLTQTKWILTGSSYPRLDQDDFKKLMVIIPKKLDQEQLLLELRKLERGMTAESESVEELGRKIIDYPLSKLGVEPSSVPRFSLTDERFFKFVDEVTDRFDFVWNHPISGRIREMLVQRKAKPLGDIIEGDFEYGLNASGKEDGNVPFVNVENLDLDGSIHTDEIHYLDEAPESKILKQGDILISRSRTVGTAGLVTDDEEGFTFGSYLLRFRVRPSLADPQLVTSFINSSLGQAQITFLQSGSRGVERGGGNNINPTQLKQLKVLLPGSESDREVIKAEIDEQHVILEEKMQELNAKAGAYYQAFEKALLEPVESQGRVA